MSAGPLSLHWPGRSPVHRAPVGLKLAVLLAASVVVVAAGSPLVSATVLAAALAGLVGIGVPARIMWRLMRPFVMFGVLIVVLQAIFGRIEAGRDAALRMVAVAAAAVLLTATTRPAEITDWVERTLRRLGLREDRVFRVGVVVGTALRSIDHLGVVVHRVLDARRARGLGRSLRAFAVPTVVAAGRFAHDLGEALDARGISAPDPPARRPEPEGRQNPRSD